MSADWYKSQLKNRNYLSPLGFKLELELFDGVDFFCQQANIPEITMPVTQVPTRYRSVPIVPGGGVTFGDFSVQFIICLLYTSPSPRDRIRSRMPSSA